jgi:hypothetical protein
MSTSRKGSERFTDSAGDKRRGYRVTCLICGKGFCTRLDQPRKYCSKNCQFVGQRRQQDFRCAFCGTHFQRKVSTRACSRSGFHFCSRNCKDEAQRIGGIEEIMPPHFGTGDGSDRYRDLFNHEGLVCARCHYHEFSCGIDIHHRDGNKGNNRRENLVPLCSPCHRALHLKLWALEELLGPSSSQDTPASGLARGCDSPAVHSRRG